MKPLKIHKPAPDTFHPIRIMAGIEVADWLFNGIRMIYLDGTPDKKTLLEWDGEEDEITMCFNLLGKCRFTDEKQSFEFEFSDHQHNIVYCRNANTQLVADGSILKLVLISLSKTSFFDIGLTENSMLNEFSKRMSREDSAALFPHNLSIGFLLQTCMNAALNCNYERSLKRIFLFSKVVELLVLQLESFKTDQQAEKSYLKSDYDRERIFYAKEYLLKNMHNPPSLHQLARVSGINEFKLKKGFKELFNQTVYEYLSDVRLETGKNDLLENKKTVSQIAFELGYSSVQHFSNSFKRKFGVPPSRLR
jgi:AraC family transcriptional activator of pyochelin receptor